MKRIWNCRRTFVAIAAIGCLTFLGFYASMDVASAIATVALSVCAANAAQGVFERKEDESEPMARADID